MRNSLYAIFCLAILGAIARAEPPPPSENPYQPPAAFSGEVDPLAHLHELQFRHGKALRSAYASLGLELSLVTLWGLASTFSNEATGTFLVGYPFLTAPTTAATLYFLGRAERAKDELHGMDGPFADSVVEEEKERLQNGPMKRFSGSLCARVAKEAMVPVPVYRALQLGISVLKVQQIGSAWQAGTLLDLDGLKQSMNEMVENGKRALRKVGL